MVSKMSCEKVSDLLLLALKLEKGDHEPGNQVGLWKLKK